MKHLTSVLLFSSLLFSLHGQPYGIIELNIEPEQPTDRDSISARISLIFPTLQYFFAAEDTVIEDMVLLDLYYCGRGELAIDVREDTFDLGPLLPGDYHLICQVFEYGPELEDGHHLDSTCVPRTTYRDTLPFKVDLLDRISKAKPHTWKLAPNPASDFLQINTGEPLQLLRLWSANGLPVRQWDQPPIDGEQISLLHLPKGIYFLELTFKDNRRTWERILIQ